MIFNNLKDIKLGTTQINKVMLGSQVIWQKQGGELPSGYTKCKYLESSGTQWVDTGILLTSDTDIYLKYSLQKRVTSGIFGARNLSAGWAFVSLYFSGDRRIYCNFRGRNQGNIALYYTTVGTPVDVELKYQQQNLTAEFNGEVLYVPYDNIPFECKYTALLFSFHDGGNVYTPSSIKLYSAIFGRSEFIPCLDANGIPCMYDTVTQAPFYNQGTGTFGYELLDGTYVAPQ